MSDYDITTKGEEYIDSFMLDFLNEEKINYGQPKFDTFKLLWNLRETGSVRKFLDDLKETHGGKWKASQLIKWAVNKELIIETSRPLVPITAEGYRDSPRGRSREEMWDQYSKDVQEAARQQESE